MGIKLNLPKTTQQIKQELQQAQQINNVQPVIENIPITANIEKQKCEHVLSSKAVFEKNILLCGKCKKAILVILQTKTEWVDLDEEVDVNG